MSRTTKTSFATPAIRSEDSSTGKAVGRPSTKEFRDTASGCRDRASADLAKALSMSTQNGRELLETSAASWTKRAEMLQRIENGIAARLEKPAAEHFYPGAGASTPAGRAPR